MKRVKVYCVKFLRYTNCMEDTVSDAKDDASLSKDFKDVKYLDVKPPFLIKEEDIPYYQKFGGGFKDLTFVGYLGEPDVTLKDPTSDTSGITINPLDIRDFNAPYLKDTTVNPVKRIEVEIGDSDYQYMTTTHADSDTNSSVVLDTTYNNFKSTEEE